MQQLENLRIYPFIKDEIDVERYVLNASPLPRLMANRYLTLAVTRQNFNRLGLREKPPVYFKGVKQYVEYYADYDPELDLFVEDTLIARLDYTDLTLPRYWKLGVYATGLNSVSLSDDRTSIISIGDEHMFIDGSDGETIKGTAIVASVNYALGYTVVTYNSLPNTVALGDICRFANGIRLAGVQIAYSWYNNDGSVGLSNTERVPLSIAEAGDLERVRREKSVSHMISNAKNTDIQDEVELLRSHYKDEIEKYEVLGDWQTWTAAIDNEVDPTIIADLAIPVPVRQPDGSLLIKTVKEYMKTEMYKGYN